MKYFAIFHFLLIGSAYFSQQYYHAPNDTLIESLNLDESVSMNITQVHPGQDTLHFFWELIESTVPHSWDASICDNTGCYSSLIPTGQSLQVLPGDDGFMLIHCTPHSDALTAVIRYSIYEAKTPDQVDTLTWIIEGGQTSSLTSQEILSPQVTMKDGMLVANKIPEQFDFIRIHDLMGRTLIPETEISEATFQSFIPGKGLIFIEFIGNEQCIQYKTLLE